MTELKTPLTSIIELLHKVADNFPPEELYSDEHEALKRAAIILDRLKDLVEMGR